MRRLPFLSHTDSTEKEWDGAVGVLLRLPYPIYIYVCLAAGCYTHSVQTPVFYLFPFPNLLSFILSIRYSNLL